MSDTPTCFHCGAPVDQPGRWSARIEGVERPMCCAGCQAVAGAIVSAGLDDYYRTRSAPAAGAAVVPPALRALEVYDDADLQARFVRARGTDREATLMIDGLRCGACVWLLEQGLRRRPGVVGVSVNLATGRATLDWIRRERDCRRCSRPSADSAIAGCPSIRANARHRSSAPAGRCSGGCSSPVSA